ncbi:ABC transporter substrate-binding protein [Mesorhizobium sp. M0924]|uniref:ABC transporter substrate-binding protein n=1 Tax=unclassified Mesorhizobium TaxID=325217 RepID=UPI003338C836
MRDISANRRQVLAGAGVLATTAALGLKPAAVLAAVDGTLKVRVRSDLQSLDPGYFVGTDIEAGIIYACLPRLAVTIRDAAGNWGWRASDNVENIEIVDQTHIVFSLKPGQMWSGDLGELTADDVKYSFERLLTSDWKDKFSSIERVDVKDKYSGVIILKDVFPGLFLTGLANYPAAILPKAAMTNIKDGRFTTDLPGQLGPYTLVSWTANQKAVLKANPQWKGKKPAFSEIEMLVVADRKSAELAFEAHEVQLTEVSAETAARYRSSPPANAKLIELPGFTYTWMGMNTEHPKLQDPRVRKAIQRAVDVTSVLQGAYSGLAPKAFGVVFGGVVGHRGKSNYKYAPDEARSLLKEARVSGLSLSLVVLTSEEAHVAAAQIIQANLADVGIEVNIVPTNGGVYWNLGQESKGDDWKKLEMWIMEFSGEPDPAGILQWFKKDQIGIWNWERWSDPEFEDLWSKGLVEQNADKRAPICVRMQEIMEDTGAYCWLTFPPSFCVSSDKVGPAFDATARPMFPYFRET